MGTIITAIPTLYSGVQFKSRLEAQCALLFDRLRWEWQYEPKSFMLPNGVGYQPDFYLPASATFVECRGYSSDRADSQIEQFGKLIREGLTVDGISIQAFVSFKQHDVRFSRRDKTAMAEAVLVAHCKCCQRYVLLGIGDEECHQCYAHACSLHFAVVLQVIDGKIRLNGKSSEQWNEVLD